MSRFNFIAAYIMADRKNGALHIGSAPDLVERVRRHKQGAVANLRLKKRFQLLVWYHRFATLEFALRKAHEIKRLSRRKQVNLINKTNPFWRDLSTELP